MAVDREEPPWIPAKPPEELLEELEKRRKEGTVEKAQVNGQGAPTPINGVKTNGFVSNGDSTTSHGVNGDAKTNGDTNVNGDTKANGDAKVNGEAKRIRLSSPKDFMAAALSPRLKSESSIEAL